MKLHASHLFYEASDWTGDVKLIEVFCASLKPVKSKSLRDTLNDQGALSQLPFI